MTFGAAVIGCMEGGIQQKTNKHEHNDDLAEEDRGKE